MVIQYNPECENLANSACIYINLWLDHLNAILIPTLGDVVM